MPPSMNMCAGASRCEFWTPSEPFPSIPPTTTKRSAGAERVDQAVAGRPATPTHYRAGGHSYLVTRAAPTNAAIERCGTQIDRGVSGADSRRQGANVRTDSSEILRGDV